MLELIFFIFAVGLVGYYFRQLSHGRPAKVGRKAGAGELTQLSEYAEKLYLQRKYLSAEKVYLKILKLDHKNVVAYRRLGLIYSAQKNYDEAIESFQIAAHLDPTTVNFFNLGVAFYENSNFVKALAAFEKGLIFGATAELYAALGKTQLKLNNTTQGVHSFEKAVQLKGDKKLLSQLAEIYMLAGRNDEAMQTYEKVLKIDPTDAKAKRFTKKTATTK